MKRVIIRAFALASVLLFAVLPAGALPFGGGPVGGTTPTIVGRVPLAFTSCFVDPANASTHALDGNTCATALVPISTTARLNALLFQSQLAGNTTVTYLSDDASGTLLDYSSVLIPAGLTLTFQGTPQVTHTGGTLNAGTIAINPAAAGGGQAQVVHTSDVADFTPFVFNGIPFGTGTSPHPQYLLDTTGGNNGTSAWIVNTGGGDAPNVVTTPDMSRPVDSTGVAAGTLAIGNAYKIQRGSLLAVAGAASSLGDTSKAFDVDTSVFFRDFAFTTANVGTGGATYYRCSLDGPLQVGGSFRNSYLGADITELGIPISSVNLDSGVLITVGGAGEIQAPFNLSGDPYITGSGFDVGQVAYAAPFIAAGIGSGIQIQRMPGVGMHVREGNYELGSDAIGTALIWGKSNGVGILLDSGATVVVSATTRPTVTGSGHDFAFLTPPLGAEVFVARPWNESTGVYGPSLATSWANFAAACCAAGFGNQAHNVGGMSAIIGD